MVASIGSWAGRSIVIGFGRGLRHSSASFTQCAKPMKTLSPFQWSRHHPWAPSTRRMLAIAPRRLRLTQRKMIAAIHGGEYRFHHSGP